MLKKVARVFFGLLFLFVTYLTLTPNPDTTDQGMALTRWIADLLFGYQDMGDKVAHFLAYGALGFWAAGSQVRLFGKHLYSVAALVCYGALLELVQGLGGVRTPELADAISNALGAFCGYLGVWGLHVLAAKRRAP